MKKFIILVVGATLIGLLSLTAVAAGTDAGSFAREGIGARALAMGGAFVAVADDSSAGYWNPAGIGYMTGYHLGGMYVIGGQFSVSGIKYQDLSFVGKPIQTGSLSALGVGITWINHVVSDIPYNENGATGTFSDNQSLFLLSLAWPFDLGSWNISAGVNVKYYRHTVLTGVGSGFGFDLGVLARVTVGDIPVTLGALSTDTMETTIHWQGTQHNPTNYVPWIVKGGASAALLDGKLRLSGDIELSALALHSTSLRHSNLDQAHLGVEATPISELALRGGVIFWRDGVHQWAVGVGLTPWQGITVDYAYVREASGLGGVTHVLSVDFSFSSFKLPNWKL